MERIPNHTQGELKAAMLNNDALVSCVVPSLRKSWAAAARTTLMPICKNGLRNQEQREERLGSGIDLSESGESRGIWFEAFDEISTLSSEEPLKVFVFPSNVSTGI